MATLSRKEDDGEVVVLLTLPNDRFERSLDHVHVGKELCLGSFLEYRSLNGDAYLKGWFCKSSHSIKLIAIQ